MERETHRCEGYALHGGTRLRFVRWSGGTCEPTTHATGAGSCVPSGGAAAPSDSRRRPAPLVLLHGFAQSAESWACVAPRLARSRTVYALDLVGHGGSDRPADPAAYGLDAQADALIAFLDEVAAGIGGPVVVGYSMGGRVALAAALRDSSRLGALVLESAGLGPLTQAERDAAATADTARANRLRAQGVRSFMDDWERLPLFATQAGLPAAVRERLRAQRLANDAEALARTFEGAGQHAMPGRAQALGRLRRAPFPVLYLCGGLDAKYRAQAEALARLEGASNVSVEVVEGVGHNVHLEAPRAFARSLEAFLAHSA